MKKQNTLGKSVKCSGVGLHSGEIVNMVIKPAAVDSGITFFRSDILGFDPSIKANYQNVTGTNLGTTIANDEGTLVSTVEHLMAALWGCGVDNAIVELDGAEVPIMDGSSEPFVFLIDCAGIRQQETPRRIIEVLKTVEVRDDNKFMSIKPADKFSVNLEIDFDSDVISKQRAVFQSDDLSFKTNLCRARTFGFEHEVSGLKDKGLARGGSLDNAVVIGGGKILNADGLRYNDEFVRHKILDCIGDFYLAGSYIKGEFSGFRTGHGLNNRLLKEFFADQSAWQYSSQ